MSWIPTSLVIDQETSAGGGTLSIFHYTSFTGETPALGMRFSVIDTGPNIVIAYLDVGTGVAPNNTLMQGQVTAVNLVAQTVTCRNTNATTTVRTATGTAEPMVQGANLNYRASSPPPYSNSPWVLAYPYTPTTGNLLLVFAMTTASNSATAVISDTGTHTWTLLQRLTGMIIDDSGTSLPTTFWLWSSVANGAASTATVTSGTLAGDMMIYECQGPLTLDQINAQYIADATLLDPILGAAVTPTQANELVIGFFAWSALGSVGGPLPSPWFAMGMGDIGFPQGTGASVNYSAAATPQTPKMLLTSAHNPEAWGTVTTSWVRAASLFTFVPQVGAFFSGI